MGISKSERWHARCSFCHYFQIHGQSRKPHQTASAHESCHRQRPLATPITGCQVATSVEGPSATHHSKRGCASGEAPPPPTDTPFVAVARLRAAVHAKCPCRPGRARCGWAWSASRAVHHLSQPSHFLPSDGCQASVCTRCRAAVTDSESSDGRWHGVRLRQVGHRHPAPGGSAPLAGGGRVVALSATSQKERSMSDVLWMMDAG